MHEPGHAIAHVVLSLDVGGLERVVATLAQAQHQSGRRVSVCCLDRAGALAEALPPAAFRYWIVSLTKSDSEMRFGNGGIL